MASVFSHIAVPVALKVAFGSRFMSWRLLLWGAFLSVAPDLDSIGFWWGVPYESQWGHRGFTHSFFFAFVIALLSVFLFRKLRASRFAVFVVSMISMSSHSVLDACNNGGLGVAFFWPLDHQRYFLPWQVVEVSPLSVARFFTGQGLVVLKSEWHYIWMPCLIFAILGFICRRFFRSKDGKQRIRV